MRNSTLLIVTITLIALSGSYEQVRAQANSFDSFGYTYTFDNFGYSSLSAAPLSFKSTSMLGMTKSRSFRTHSSNNTGVSVDFVIIGEIGLKETLTSADLGNHFNEMVLSSSRPKHTCVLAKGSTPSQRAGFDECRANLPDCDKMRWDVSGEGHRILSCKCYRIFSSC